MGFGVWGLGFGVWGLGFRVFSFNRTRLHGAIPAGGDEHPCKRTRPSFGEAGGSLDVWKLGLEFRV